MYKLFQSIQTFSFSEFERADKDEPVRVDHTLNFYLSGLARNGDPIFPWHRIRNLIRYKLETVRFTLQFTVL